MKHSYCLSGGSVIGRLEGRDKYTAIHELIHRAPVFDQVKDRDRFEEAVVARERLHSTGLGHGVALAHGKTSQVNRLFIAMGRSPGGIDFDTPDGEPVYFLFIIGNPPEAQDDYIKVVGALAGVMRNSSFRKKLFSIKTGEEVEAVLKKALWRAL